MRKSTIASTIVVLAVLATFGAVLYAALGSTPATSATIRAVVPHGFVYGASEPTYSGIENIYIIENTHAAGYTVNFSGNENVMGTITSSGGSTNIAYETRFKIVVAVKGHDENMAYVQEENLQVELAASGTFSITQENSTNAMEYVFAENAGVWIRCNVVWDNNGAGYILPAGGSVSLNPVRLWCWE